VWYGVYDVQSRNLVYASAAKGFRPGGGQIPLPNACDSDLRDFGYVDANGNTFTPTSFKSDSVWSYEVGSKNKILGNFASIAASAYLIKWKGIQTSLFLPTCAYNIIDNLTAATIKGFDLSLDVRPAKGLTLSANVGYSHSSLDESLVSPTGSVILAKGSSIDNSGPPWTVILSGQYEARLGAELGGYLRGDITFTSEERPTGNTDPRVFNYDPRLRTNPELTLVNTRIGLTRDGYDLSLFVNNLFDRSPISELRRTRYVFTGQTIQPRTIGVTFTARR